FFVRCDRSTMTQNDLDNGRLICLIGVAVIKPAEFVIFRIGQKTADARTTPYGAFNFLVNINGPVSPDDILGGFSDCTGLGTEIKVSEYRNGNEKESHVRKVPGTHTVSDVTLKRGVVNSQDLWAWIDATRRTGPRAKREVVIT